MKLTGTLTIPNWNDRFENNRTRELKKMDWVPVPNKHDSDGFTELMDHPNGMAHYGAWVLIVQVASRCGTRGTLLRDGARPHDFHSLARMTHGDAKVFEEAVPRLISIGWLSVSACESTAPQEGAAAPAESRTTMRDGDYARAVTEGKGREGNRREEKERGAPAKPDARARFQAPNQEEWVEYGTTIGMSSAESIKAFDYFVSNGWRVGKNPMKDWRASLRVWGSRDFGRTNGGKPKPEARQIQETIHVRSL